VSVIVLLAPLNLIEAATTGHRAPAQWSKRLRTISRLALERRHGGRSLARPGRRGSGGLPWANAAWALGLMSLVAIPGQIALGHVSDRIGREAVWAVGCAGFAVCYLTLIALHDLPTPILCVMVVSQGTLGYALASVIGPSQRKSSRGPTSDRSSAR